MAKVDARISVTDIPEAIAALRSEMAGLLRAEAEQQEDNVVGYAVAKSLRSVAAAFEAGVGRDGLSRG